MEDRTDERTRSWSERFDAGVSDFGRLVVLQCVVEVMKILYNLPLMLVILQLS